MYHHLHHYVINSHEQPKQESGNRTIQTQHRDSADQCIITLTISSQTQTDNQSRNQVIEPSELHTANQCIITFTSTSLIYTNNQSRNQVIEPSKLHTEIQRINVSSPSPLRHKLTRTTEAEIRQSNHPNSTQRFSGSQTHTNNQCRNQVIEPSKLHTEIQRINVSSFSQLRHKLTRTTKAGIR